MLAKNRPKQNIIRKRKRGWENSKGGLLRQRLGSGRIKYFMDSSGNVHALGPGHSEKAAALGWKSLSPKKVNELLDKGELKYV